VHCCILPPERACIAHSRSGLGKIAVLALERERATTEGALHWLLAAELPPTAVIPAYCCPGRRVA
jgi:hypothetical protein